MNSQKYVFSSLTRISDLDQNNFTVQPFDRSSWEDGDYILTEVIANAGGALKIELINGRMVDAMIGDQVIGALGTRYATLEATGGWQEVNEDGVMHLLTAAGLMGKMTSKSYLLPELIQIKYIGHILRNGQCANMHDYASSINIIPFRMPVILMVGTSMSAGKTTSGKIVTKLLSNAGLDVVGAKLTGAGRLRDILAFKDAGATSIFDFVDVGLPSTILSSDRFLPLLRQLLSKIQHTNADICVLEIGASPLEPYNGDLAITAIQDQIVFTILCATDPYAVYGVMQSFSLIPDLVSGPATNTLAGQTLIKKLCQVPALNLVDGNSGNLFSNLLAKKIPKDLASRLG